MPYNVRGSFIKEDDKSPRDILISVSYPPLYPSSEGNICGLKVFRKGPSEEFPVLAFSHPDYATEPIDLNDTNSVKINNEELSIRNTIKLLKIGW